MGWKWGGAPTPPTAPPEPPEPATPPTPEPAAEAPLKPPVRPPPPEFASGGIVESDKLLTLPEPEPEPSIRQGDLVGGVVLLGGGSISDIARTITSAPRPPNLPTEPAMSADLTTAVGRAIPAALALFNKLQIDEGTLESLVSLVGTAADRAGLLAARGKLDEKRRDKLCAQTCDDIRDLAPDIAEPALVKIGEIIIDVIDAKIDTGPFDGIDGEIAKRGLPALIEKLTDWTESLGNSEARLERAKQKVAKWEAETKRLEALVAAKRAAAKG